MIGTAVYAGYEAYKSTEIDWNKLENGIYDAADLAMFRVGFTMARQQFLATAAGAAAQQAGSKYILIPSEVMPTVAQVDMIGITQFSNSLTWEPDRREGASGARVAWAWDRRPPYPAQRNIVARKLGRISVCGYIRPQARVLCRPRSVAGTMDPGRVHYGSGDRAGFPGQRQCVGLRLVRGRADDQPCARNA